MTLRQLQYITEIARCGLSVSAAARALHTSQPGISRQVHQLEAELGIEIFLRSRNRLSAITEQGERVLAYARLALDEVDNIGAVAAQSKRPRSGTLTIATTHTQARYVLPEVIKTFSRHYPRVRLTLQHGDPAQIVERVSSGAADFGVTTDTGPPRSELLVFPCRRFQRVLIVPAGHKLLASRPLTLAKLARYPLISYEPQYTGRVVLYAALEQVGLSPNVVVSAIDADVIKTCVEQGLGVAVLSEVTFDALRDSQLRAIPARHLFAPSITHMVVHRSRFLQHYAYDFIEYFAPEWTRARVQHEAGLRQRGAR